MRTKVCGVLEGPSGGSCWIRGHPGALRGRAGRDWECQLRTNHYASISIFYQPALLLPCVSPNTRPVHYQNKNLCRRAEETQGLSQKSLWTTFCIIKVTWTCRHFFTFKKFIHIFNVLFRVLIRVSEQVSPEWRLQQWTTECVTRDFFQVSNSYKFCNLVLNMYLCCTLRYYFKCSTRKNLVFYF